MVSTVGIRNKEHARKLAHSTGLGLALLVSGLVVGCGGGGGDSGTSVPAEQPQGDGQAIAPELTIGADSFYFAPGAANASASSLNKVAGGTALTAFWDPNDGNTALSPGMKIFFFGQAQGCTAGSQGPLDSFSDTRLADVSGLTGVPADAVGAELRWVPSANTSACDAASRAKRGASSAFLNASDANGAMALLTSSGIQSDGQASFFGPYSSSGQNGKGDNAYITGTFVNFRHAAWLADPLQPWLNGTKARLRSEQGLTTASVEGGRAMAQVKQQMMATFYNHKCRQDEATNPCQIQYLMDTAIMRTGVSNWSGESWFVNAKVWGDPVQGGIPIVSGPIYGNGVTTSDSERGLALWTSQGEASQHATFAAKTFDVTISLDQLVNVLRITTGRAVNKAPSAVSDAEIASLWGSAWNDPGAWALLSTDVAQEVYNPDSNFRAEIGGGFKSLFVGPQ
ncbi:hypothetical protein [Ideonella sp.]|uniref:hypothetical protein n=1 Tax=Ideonella sp. TaxID=1929293 RepID=UPI00351B11DA